MSEITAKIAQELRLTEEEFHLIIDKLGRTPNFTELCAFSGMWSEHCSYKNSIKWLKTLPRSGGRMLVEAGEENAGLMDIGNNYGVVFKIESHNHPSAIEPFQGAATGVGGIQRDIFTMGARPIASLNSLRFGKIEDNKTQRLLAGIVHGIGHYGNCFGVPTVGGEVYFEECYHTNPLVNAMSVGIVKIGDTVSATALGEGNPVFYVGSATGKDGIGGASFASANITAESTEELPAVQVGDPFQEKKLLEACLEVIQTGAIVGMQDMGAAGIICSTAEMSAKGGVGMHIDLDKVPTRQQNMKAWELLLSESQERMLMVVEKGREAEVLKVFDKWDLSCSEVGHVTLDGILSFYMNGVLEAALPANELVLGGGAPQYERPYSEPVYLQKIAAFDINTIPDIKDENELLAVAKQIIQLPNIASKRWVYTQYDSMVGTGNVGTNGPSDASVVLVKETGKALAITTDCNSRYVFADPYKGAQIAVAEAARNIVCSGGEPIGITNCLNFGNPYQPEVYYQFVQAIKGMGDACRKFNTPVTGGNVSFYNQHPDGAVYPTPTIGMVGIVDDLENITTIGFTEGSEFIILLGKQVIDDIGSSEYIHKIKGIEYSNAPYFDLDEEIKLQNFVAKLIKDKVLVSAHDVSEGGIMVTLLESAFVNEIGISVIPFDFYVDDYDKESDSFIEVAGENVVNGMRKDSFWFGESQGRVIVSVKGDNLNSLLILVEKFDIQTCLLGYANNTQTITVNKSNWGTVAEWKELYTTAIEKKITSH